MVLPTQIWTALNQNYWGFWLNIIFQWGVLSATDDLEIRMITVTSTYILIPHAHSPNFTLHIWQDLVSLRLFYCPEGSACPPSSPSSLLMPPPKAQAEVGPQSLEGTGSAACAIKSCKRNWLLSILTPSSPPEFLLKDQRWRSRILQKLLLKMKWQPQTWTAAALTLSSFSCFALALPLCKTKECKRVHLALSYYFALIPFPKKVLFNSLILIFFLFKE